MPGLRERVAPIRSYRSAHDSVAGLDAADRRPDLLHDSDRLMPEGEILARADRAVHRMRIGGADECERGFDDRVGRAGLRHRLFRKSDLVDAIHHEGFHRRPSRIARLWCFFHRHAPDARSRGKRDRQLEHAVAPCRDDVLPSYTLWNRDRTRKTAVADLAMYEVARFVFHLSLARGTDRQQAPLHSDFDIFGIDAGQFGANHQLVLMDVGSNE